MLLSLLLLFLSAYSSVETPEEPSGYQEYLISDTDREFLFMTKEERKELEEKNDFLFESGEIIEYDQATQTFVHVSGDEKIVQEFEYWKDITVQVEKEREEYTILSNGFPLVTTQIDYSPQFQEVGIRKIAFIDDLSAITLQRFKNGVSITDILYGKRFLSDQFSVDEVKYMFVYKEKIGIIGREGLNEYVFYDGKKVSPAFDTITTESCCAAPLPITELYDNGAFVFVGTRDEQNYFTEVDLNQN